MHLRADCRTKPTASKIPIPEVGLWPIQFPRLNSCVKSNCVLFSPQLHLKRSRPKPRLARGLAGGEMLDAAHHGRLQGPLKGESRRASARVIIDGCRIGEVLVEMLLDEAHCRTCLLYFDGLVCRTATQAHTDSHPLPL